MAEDQELELQSGAEVPAPPKRRGRPPKEAKPKGVAPEIEAGEEAVDYRHNAKRKNNPLAGLAAQNRVAEPPKITYAYNPHLPPVLRFDATGEADRIQELLALAQKRVLNNDEVKALQEAFSHHQPWLEWSGKREKKGFQVDPVALHIHERVSTQAILRAVQRLDIQRSLFADPEMDAKSVVEFYQHDVDWANRLILGDSLQVMASLARRENLAGQIQMIFMDPPYGIKFSSNFQSEVGNREVNERESDLTREPEMVKAYRDTWLLGIHSYLAYLKDRIILAKELLHDSGSIFVQISDENLHRVRIILDEVFGPSNFCSLISFQKTGSIATNKLPTTVDYILWYAKDSEKAKYNQLYVKRTAGDPSLDRYDQLLDPIGASRSMTPEEKSGETPFAGKRFQLTSLFSDGASKTPQIFNFRNVDFEPKSNSHWKTTIDGLKRLAKAGRIEPQNKRLRYVRYADDFGLVPLSDRWQSVQIGKETLYVVQTASKVIERCILMTTDPGDLVLDPT